MQQIPKIALSVLISSLVACGGGTNYLGSSGSSSGSSSSTSSSSSSTSSSSSSSSSSSGSASSSSGALSGGATLKPAGLPKHWHETKGWGTDTKGGLEGKVIKVTNLNNSGPGSFRAAVEASGKRLIVFEVGGVIDLDAKRIRITNGDVTIAGQTAPYPGITLIRADFVVDAADVVISHISTRLGDGTALTEDTMALYGSNIVLNHVAASWSIDECLSMRAAKNSTLYKTMITEALSYATHVEGEHSKGSLIKNSTNNVSMINVLYAHNAMRNPRLHSGSKVALINSVIYDWFPGHDDEGDKNFDFIIHMNDAAMSIVGNVALQGPESVGDVLVSGHKTGTGEAYMRDNLIIDPKGNPLTEYNTENITPLDTPPLWPDGVEVMPNHESFYELIRTIGPRPGDRDKVNARVVRTIVDGTGGRVNSQEEVGGYPNYAETRRKVTVPEGYAARRAWLDKLEDDIAVDTSLDLSRLYKIIGSQASDKLVTFE